jgi:hypothetical protein
MMRWGLAVVVVLALSPAARADEVLYVEALGKGGAYGVGYEHGIARHISAGAAASFMSIEGQHVYTIAPYLHARVLGERRHRMFAEVGAVLAHSRIPSPVDDWDGMAETGTGGFLSLGYEYARGHLVMRASAAVVAGEGGLAPMIGLAIGARP